jgi:hypothetical protein
LRTHKSYLHQRLGERYEERLYSAAPTDIFVAMKERRVFPILAFMLLLLWCVTFGTNPTVAAEASLPAIDIGSRLELFVDGADPRESPVDKPAGLDSL